MIGEIFSPGARDLQARHVRDKITTHVGGIVGPAGIHRRTSFRRRRYSWWRPSRAAGPLGALTRPDQRRDGLLASAVAVDVASDWQTRFPEAGDTWQMAHYNFVPGNQTADSPCGIVGDPDDFPNASNPPDQTFACSSDLTAYMSVDWVRDHIWDNGADPTGAPDTMGVGAAIALSSSPPWDT